MRVAFSQTVGALFAGSFLEVVVGKTSSAGDSIGSGFQPLVFTGPETQGDCPGLVWAGPLALRRA